jgi:hypothetical protein
LKPVVVAGVGGLMLGHIVWLIGISLARGASPTHALILVAAALVFLAAGGIGYLAWQRYQRNELVWAAFLGALPVLPVILTLIALAATYL